MIDPNERHTFIDKNWEKGISFLDAKSDYWKQTRNMNQSDYRRLNEAMRESNGRIVREATKEELAELIAP